VSVHLPTDTFVAEDERWTKFSEMIPMRDGTLLYNVITLPVNTSLNDQLPVVLDRTPYSADFVYYGDSERWIPKGYAVVTQDMRGRFRSEGEWSFWRMSAYDGPDTINWIRNQPWCNNMVFAFGSSADGIAAAMEQIPSPIPPGLQAQFLIVGTGHLYLDTFQNGAYRQSLFNGWSIINAEEDYIPTIYAHERYGPFWYSTNLARNWSNCNVPIVHWGGWYDIFAEGTIDNFNGMQYNGGPGAKGAQYLVMEAGGHCSGGQYPFPANAKNSLADHIAYDMFENIVRGEDPTEMKYSHINFYLMGADATGLFNDPTGNFWVCMDEWPPVQSTNLFLGGGGTLSLLPSSSTEAVSSYIYDPNDPVDTLGGPNLVLPQCGPWDQQEVERRSDVLTFRTDALAAPVAVVGRMSLTLYFSTNVTDTDFMAKLTDKYPDGRSYNVIDNGIRTRWRNRSVGPPQSLTPGQITEVTIDLQTVAYVFEVGHSIQVDLTSSNYPRFSLNRNNGNLLADGPGTPVVAHHTIYHSADYPSALLLPVTDFGLLQSGKCRPR